MNKIWTVLLNKYLSKTEAISLIIIFFMIFMFFKIMGQIILPITISIIISYYLYKVVNYLKHINIPHLIAVTIVFATFIGGLLAVTFLLLPILYEQIIELVSDIPRLCIYEQNIVMKVHRVLPDIFSIGQLEQLISSILGSIINFGKEILMISLVSLLSFAKIIIYLILIPILVFFFLRDGSTIIQWLTSFLPSRSKVLENIWQELTYKVRCYIRGKIVEIIIITIISSISFWLLGLRYAGLLGISVGISAVIAYVGVTLVTIPILFVGMMQWGWTEHFFYLLLIYTIINILDSYILVPILFSETMDLNPLAIIMAVLFFGKVFGIVGIFFAIPLLTLVSITIKYWPKNENYL